MTAPAAPVRAQACKLKLAAKLGNLACLSNCLATTHYHCERAWNFAWSFILVISYRLNNFKFEQVARCKEQSMIASTTYLFQQELFQLLNMERYSESTIESTMNNATVN